MPTGHPDNASLIAVRVAELLFAYGQTTERVNLAVERLGRLTDRRMFAAVRWGDLTIQSEDGLPLRQAIVQPSGVDIRKVIAVESLVDDICASRTDVDAALPTLDSIRRLSPVSLPRLAVMAAAGAGALGIIFGAPDVFTTAVIALSAGVGALLRRGLSRVSTNAFVQPFVAALLAGAVASLTFRLDLPISHGLVAVCPCMVLVPGPHFLNGCIDLARARISLGAARLAFAGLIVMAISAGLLTGLSIASPFLPAAKVLAPIPIGFDVAAAGVAVAAYGAFFNMPWRLLPIPIAVGMLAHALRWQVLASGASLSMGAFVACLLVGAVMTPLSISLRLPFGASAFAAVVSLIPGIYMFETVSDALELISRRPAQPSAIALSLLENITMATSILLAMAIGLIAPKIILGGALRNVSWRRPARQRTISRKAAAPKF